MKFAFPQSKNHKIATLLEQFGLEWTLRNADADVLVIPGGADVHPTYYGDTKSKMTNAGRSDERDFKAIKEFVDDGRKIIGICRGAQLLCPAAGGALIQHVWGHRNVDHLVEFADGNSFLVNSRHHQMMYPYGINRKHYSIIGWANGISHKYVDKSNEEKPVEDHLNSYTVGQNMVGKKCKLPSVKKFFSGRAGDENAPILEPEVIVFHNINGLAIQYHPEDMMEDKKYRNAMRYTEKIIQGFLMNEI